MVFIVFVFLYETHIQQKAEKRVEKHARVVADALWNFNRSVIREYVVLAAKADNYEKLWILDDMGVSFVEVESEKPAPFEQILLFFKMIRRIEITSPVKYHDIFIGNVRVIWLDKSMYVYMYTLFSMLTVFAVFHLYMRLLEAKRELENRVIERTRALAESNEKLVMEIDERKRIEQALRESEERFRTAMEANPDPVVLYDMEGSVIYFNPAFTKVFGWKLEERAGKKMDPFVPEKNLPETRKMIRKVLSGESIPATETVRLSKDGERIPVIISGGIFHNRENEPIGSIINIRDIREAKRLQEKLQQVQRMEAIGTLAGGIAHDFNNLLMGIQGRNSLMMADLEPEHPYYEHLNGIESYVQSASSLTQQLLGFARAGKYDVKTINMNELVDKTTTMFGRTRKELEIRKKLADDLLACDLDTGQMEQVLLNIYVNAWQAMPGGGTLTVETENAELNQEEAVAFSVQPGKYVHISVTDTGVGMDKKTIKRVFDPFFTTKEMSRGTGLGLASAYGIIKNHEGFIDVYSEPGQGTTFHLYLPASEKKLAKEKQHTTHYVTGTETILLVDDEPMIREVGEGILKRLGYSVFLASGGSEALQILKDHIKEIDIIILDMVMPGMNGQEVYEKIRQISPDARVLLSSGYSINGRAEEIMKNGCDGFIQKPFNMAHISRKLREILDTSQ